MSKRTRGRKPLKLTWYIENSSTSICFLGQGIESSRFVVESLGPISWRLVFYPKGYENPNYIACLLQHCGGSHDRGIAVDLEMCLKSENGAENFLKTSSNLLFKNGYSLGFQEFVTRDELKRCPYPNGVLIIQCYISNNNESNYISDLLSLSNDMELLYDEKTFYDVIIKVGKSEFKAHKTLLYSRAPHMVSLIEQNSYEDSIPFIIISDFTPAIVKDALRFLYTGDLTENRFIVGKLRNFAMKYKVESLLLELTKSTIANCIVSTEINIGTISHTLYLIYKTLYILGQETVNFHLPDSFGGGKIVMQYLVAEYGTDDISINIEISHEAKSKENYYLLLKFKGSLMCNDQTFGECCKHTTNVNCAEAFTIRFSHLFQKNIIPLNVKDIGGTVYMQCDLNLSDSANSTSTIPERLNALICFSEELYSLYTKGIGTDLVLKTADNKKFKVHKAIVCARVPSIMAMFKGDTEAVNGYVHDDLKNLQVDIPSIDSSMFEDILEYIYSGKVGKVSMDKILRLQPESVPTYMKAMQEKLSEKLNSILCKKRSKSIKFPTERSPESEQ